MIYCMATRNPKKKEKGKKNNNFGSNHTKPPHMHNPERKMTPR